MSLFPRFSQEFSPLFRMFDDYERQLHNEVDTHLKAFTPKFDVKEDKDAYHLHGEFPGVEQKDINIEWTDNNILSIKGRHETVKEEGQRPQNSGFIEEDKDKKKGRQPSVTDESEESTQVAKKGGQEVAKKDNNPVKYWVSERSVGSFHRSFAFPQAIDQDHVKASLKDGILSIVVPKAKAPQARRVKIE